MQSEQVNELAKALSQAQSELSAASKDGKNPHFNSEYATLESVLTASKPIHKYGLSLVQGGGFLGDTYGLWTTLLHSSGQWVKTFYKLAPEKNGPQSLKSANTYARRDALQSLLGIPEADDDAESAVDRSQTVTQSRVTPSAPRPSHTPVVETSPSSPPMFDQGEEIPNFEDLPKDKPQLKFTKMALPGDGTVKMKDCPVLKFSEAWTSKYFANAKSYAEWVRWSLKDKGKQSQNNLDFVQWGIASGNLEQNFLND